MTPTEYYTQQSLQIEEQLKTTKKQLQLFGLYRLLVFLAIMAAIYFFWGNTPVMGSSIFAGIVLFLWLIRRYANIKTKQRYFKALHAINMTELRVLSRDLSQQRTGSNYVHEEHDFNQDIDLFGAGSLFQYINRTALENGEKVLAAWLNSNDIDAILEKQASIQELSERSKWRQDYTATATLLDSETATDTVVKWVKNHERFVPKIYGWLPIVYSIISVTLITGYFMNLVGSEFILGAFVLGLALTGRYLQKITNMYNVTSKIDDLLSQYALLLKKIEDTTFESKQLQQWQQAIVTEGQPASKVLSQLSNEVNALSNRNNFLFALFGNAFLLWDLRYAYRIEQWIASFDGALEQWFLCIERFDAMNSLANYAFNHPNYIYPTVSRDAKLQFEAKDLGHPLLSAKKRVTNSILLNKEDFFIITGANMAGKSTFLRTVAMNLVMANSGLPVCASKFEYKPIKLISSMRTSDSLVNDESYFFSELKRLKFIVDRIQEDTYFIILDEILKGTNSVDKAEGSKKFVKRLVGSHSTGLIATHDLSLCALSDELPQVANHYFDAEIVNDELYFDYRFKEGICQNMNASFLLKKMQIVE